MKALGVILAVVLVFAIVFGLPTAVGAFVAKGSDSVWGGALVASVLTFICAAAVTKFAEDL